MGVLLGILGIVGIILIGVTVTTFVNVLMMSKPSLVRSSDTEPPTNADKWAKSNDFAFIGNFTMKIGSMNAFISAWQHSDRPSFFCQYLVRLKNDVQCVFDLVTQFANDISLTTGSRRDAHLFPCRLGHYMQSFSNISFDERWYKHIEMENYLIDAGGARLVQIDMSFEEIFLDTICKQMKYIRSLRFWALRGAYWHFVRRYLLHNRSIKQQHDKGMIKLPNELPQIELLTAEAT